MPCHEVREGGADLRRSSDDPDARVAGISAGGSFRHRRHELGCRDAADRGREVRHTDHDTTLLADRGQLLLGDGLKSSEDRHADVGRVEVLLEGDLPRVLALLRYHADEAVLEENLPREPRWRVPVLRVQDEVKTAVVQGREASIVEGDEIERDAVASGEYGLADGRTENMGRIVRPRDAESGLLAARGRR